MPTKKRKPQISKFGYGALAIYTIGILIAALGAYGISLTSILMKFNESARIREQVRTGRVIVTTDRVQCRSYRFDNMTAQVGVETVGDCEDQGLAGSHSTSSSSSNPSFGMVRDGFNGR
jgi:hypothetical protein